ncbi:hypothetical protein TIFTF001_035592 [Ficus carica]|uniref:Uncharacterized protein n=1 Tax=Ficus carica TaxID=3494 RepID=A0AA88E1W2_FICCA|nr:hypothetical protein TIFTF001_035592 [Ficus carica]
MLSGSSLGTNEKEILKTVLGSRRRHTKGPSMQIPPELQQWIANQFAETLRIMTHVSRMDPTFRSNYSTSPLSLVPPSQPQNQVEEEDDEQAEDPKNLDD